MTETTNLPATPWQRFTASQRRTNPGFEDRPQQGQLAESVTVTTAFGLHLIGEAPTGVGKSFAGLVSAIERAHTTRMPVVVATPSKTLQAQYYVKDIPAVAEHVGPVNAALLFGRANYACLAKLNGDADVPAPRLEDIEAALSEDGDLVIGMPEHVRLTTAEKAEITTTSDECPGARSCPFGDVCHFERAKRRAAEADVVVTNTAMLIAAAQTPGGVLPEWSTLIVDEAHKLPDAVVEALGWDLRAGGARRLLRAAENMLDNLDNRVVVHVEDILARLSPEPPRFNGQATRRRLREVDLAAVAEPLDNLDAWLGDVDTTLATAESHARVRVEAADDPSEQQAARETLDKLAAVRRQVAAYTRRTRDIRGFRNDQPVVMWTEHNGHAAKLIYRPLDVAPFLTENLWNRAPAVLMSATIPADLADTVGLPTAARLNVESPFNLAGQSRRYVADLVPETKPGRHDERDRWLDRLADETTALILANEGRALVLFASYGDLDQIHRRTEYTLARSGIRVLRQRAGEDAERQHLAAAFRTDETSVLYGVASFEEGVDIPGDALSLVIVTRIPNSTPDDPIFAKRVELAGGGWPGYGRVNGPAVAVRMAQGSGRLIRTATDTGLVAILDGRVRNPKGRAALAKLPNVHTYYRLDDAVAYLERLAERRRGGNVIQLRRKGA